MRRPAQALQRFRLPAGAWDIEQTAGGAERGELLRRAEGPGAEASE